MPSNMTCGAGTRKTLSCARAAANIISRTVSGFVAALGAYALSTGGAAYAALIPSVLSFVMVVALTALELIVGFLQAFVFAALACVYLNDVVNLGHGH